MKTCSSNGSKRTLAIAGHLLARLDAIYDGLTEPAFNQTQIAYNATKEEKLDKLKEVISAREAKYKVK